MTNCCDAWGRCTRGQDCPVRDLPQDASVRWWSTGCCHSADCADTHCPGRPTARRAAPPARRCDLLGVCQGHTPACEGCTPPITAHSDGSTPQADLPRGWIDRLRPPVRWALLLGGSAASAVCLLLAFKGGALCAA